MLSDMKPDNLPKHEHLIWKEESREKVFDGPIFDLYRSERISPEGKRGSFILLDSPDWVNVVPIVKDEEGNDAFVMVRQYRQGAQMITVEFPGGVVDPGETPAEAALRELKEETGYSAGKLTLAGKISPNPAYQDNWSYTYIAEDLSEAGPQNLDEHELVEYETVPVKDVEREMGSGHHIHAIMMVAMAFYEKWKNGKLGGKR